MLKPTAEPVLEFCDRADPFAGADHIGDMFHAAIRGVIIGIGAEDNVIKKKRAFVCPDVLV